MAPWHEEIDIQSWVPRTQRRKRWLLRQRQERVQVMRYGAGMVVGLIAVNVVKKAIKSIPIVGALSSPILDLFPTVLVGPAIGAAVVFTLDEGDVEVAKYKVRKAIKSAKREFEDVAREFADARYQAEQAIITSR